MRDFCKKRLWAVNSEAVCLINKELEYFPGLRDFILLNKTNTENIRGLNFLLSDWIINACEFVDFKMNELTELLFMTHFHAIKILQLKYFYFYLTILLYKFHLKFSSCITKYCIMNSMNKKFSNSDSKRLINSTMQWVTIRNTDAFSSRYLVLRCKFNFNLGVTN